MKYLKKDARAGRLIYRRAFPAALRPHIPGSPRELIRTLKARDIRDGDAYQLYKSANDEYDQTVREARNAITVAQKQADKVFDDLTPEISAFLIADYIADNLTLDDEVRWLPGSSEAKRRKAQATREDIPGDLRECLALRGMGDLEGMKAIWGDEAESLAAIHGYNFDKETDAFLQYVRAFNDANISVWETMLTRLEGSPIPSPEVPSRPVRHKVPHATEAAPRSFEAIAERVLSSDRLQLGHAIREGSQSALRFFREAHGHPTPAQMNRALVSEWLDLLAKRPAKLPKAEWSLTLPELAEKYEGRTDVARLSKRTLEKHLLSLSALWTKAQDEGLIPEERPNPFRRKIITAAVVVEKTKGMDASLINKIFALPIFTAGERPGGGKGEASYWLPLILLWTGCRPEEAAQLILEDISVDPDTKEPTLRFTDEGVHPHKGPRLLKTTKRQSGRRTIPIPRPLLDLNFLGYVEAVRAAGEVALFPQLRVKGARNLLFAGFSQWWSGYLREQGVRAEGEDWRPAREFRHAWTTAARDSGIPREAAEYIQGHKVSGGSAHEIYGSRHPLGRKIHDLSFRDLELAKVRAWEMEFKR